MWLPRVRFAVKVIVFKTLCTKYLSVHDIEQADCGEREDHETGHPLLIRLLLY
jgi:hypothetical protein